MLDTAAPCNDTADANAPVPTFLSVTLIPASCVSAKSNVKLLLPWARVLEIVPVEFERTVVLVWWHQLLGNSINFHGEWSIKFHQIHF